ncbi:MAG: AMP-binding protein [Thermodesulfobacteriota bacterium]
MDLDRPLWNPQRELMDRVELKRLQFEKLKKQLLRVYEQSPYYRAKFDRAGVNPHQFRSLEQYADYPFFDKEEERISQEESRLKESHPLGMHVVCDPRRVIRLSSTSGTTGRPTFTGYTQKDREAVNETGARCLWRTGARPGDVVLHAFVLSMWIAGCPVVDVLQNFGACVVPIGALTGVERFAQIAQEVFPKAVILTPSYAEHLIKTLPQKAGVRAQDLGLEVVCCSGEPGASIPHVRERIETGFGGARVYDAIGSTGAVFMSSVSCQAHAGMHFLAEDYCLFEVVDPKTLEALPLENGVEGEIVLTGLEKECAPLIRWRDKDIVQVFTEPCACGRPGFRFIVKGRADDMLLVRGVNVYPHAVKDVVMKFHPRVTGAMVIILESPPPQVEPPVPVRVEQAAGLPDAALPGLAREIEDQIHHRLRFTARVELVPPGTFAGAYHKTQLFDRRYERKE